MIFKLNDSNRKRNSIFHLAVVLIVLIAGGMFNSPAQAQYVDSWPDPKNLSQSGSASDPVVMVDKDGLIHVVWIDEFTGSVYSFGEGTEWSIPRPVVLPSEKVAPLLLAGNDGTFHAFWRDPDTKLFYSQGRGSSFLDSASWSPGQLIENSVLDFKVVLDQNGNLHLAYVNPLESEVAPAGIYYRQLPAGSRIWSEANLLYASPYFRSLDLESSNVDISAIAVGESVDIFVVWDNRLRERVYLARSLDNGQNWSAPQEIDRPDAGSTAAGPANILVYAEPEGVMLVWRVGEPRAVCNMFYLWSPDMGETWSLKQPIMGSMPICFEQMQIVSGAEYPILMGEFDQVYFMSWDGFHWSIPQIQASLTSFIDEETQNAIQLGCRRLTQNESNTLYVIGCDQGVGGDIWVMKRLLFDLYASFPYEIGWSILDNVASGEARMASPTIRNSHDNRIHVLWTLAEYDDQDSLGKSIYYAFQGEGQWSSPSEILASPNGKSEQVDFEVSADNDLFVVWSGGAGGEIYFSQADTNQAFSPASWSEPKALPAPRPVGSGPDLLIGQGQMLYVAYAIPLNEQRGVYLTKSEDQGQSWSEPILVFDAQSAAWDMLDHPSLEQTDDGDLHLIWTRYTLPSGEGPLELYYAKSTDEGKTWTTPEMIVAGPVVWSRIISPWDNTLQLVWQQDSSSGATLWHEQSLDSGVNWERVVPVSIFGELAGNPSITFDEAGNLHLILMVRGGAEAYFLQHWVYDGDNWSSEPNQHLQFSTDSEIRSIASAFSESWRLDVVFIDQDLGFDGDGGYQLLYMSQTLEKPENIPARDSQPTPTQTGEVVVQSTVQPTDSTPMPTETSTSTPEFPLEPETNGGSDLLVMAGPILIGFVALVVIFLVILRMRR